MKNDTRIESLDVIRGFAVLGILIMNIQSFSMVNQAYLNPTAYGDLSGINEWIWIISHVFADQKFMSLFSMLFGASILMISENAEQKTGSSIGIHYKRNFWLLIIGLIHAYGLWSGDILTPYAVIAFLVYPMRKVKVRTLLIVGTVLFSVSSILYLLTGYSLEYMSATDIAELLKSWQPSAAEVEQEIRAYTGTFAQQMSQRVNSTITMHTTVFLLIFLWRISGLMLFGMALYKSGFFQGEYSKGFYTRVALMAGTIGFTIIGYGVVENFAHDWSLEYAMFLGSQWNYWGSLAVAIAYVAIINLIIASDLLVALRTRLAAVGRMALTNYLSQTLICTFIFYGFGLGLFGQIDRSGQVVIVISIWVFQLILSSIWLKYFRYGPMEWLWRSLSQMKLQDFKKD